MEPRYLWVFDYYWGSIKCIKLSDEELEKSLEYDDFEDFIVENLESKYHFRLKDCCWMTSQYYEYEKIGF